MKPANSVPLRVVPLTLREANDYVTRFHRHHKPSRGHRFSIGVTSLDGLLRGAAIAGRPVARLAGDPRRVLEVTRVVTDGTVNACSMLYGAVARIAKNMGYEKIQTYILQSEPGVTLKASGWLCDGPAGGGQWKHTDGKARRTDQPTELKSRWSLSLNSQQPELVLPPQYESRDAGLIGDRLPHMEDRAAGHYKLSE